MKFLASSCKKVNREPLAAVTVALSIYDNVMLCKTTHDQLASSSLVNSDASSPNPLLMGDGRAAQPPVGVNCTVYSRSFSWQRQWILFGSSHLTNFNNLPLTNNFPRALAKFSGRRASTVLFFPPVLLLCQW